MLQKRSAVISGGGQGLGLAIASTLLQNHYDVTICGRNQLTLQNAVEILNERIKTDYGKKMASAELPKIFAVEADISEKEDVANLLSEALEHHQKIDVLVNNASILGPIGAFDTVDWQQWMDTIQVNLFGTMLMSRALTAHFKENGAGAIINISGGGATASRAQFSAYAASKTAVVRMTETMAEELKEFGIAVNAVSPGILDTPMLDSMLESGVESIGKAEYDKLLLQKKNGSDTLKKASQLCLFLANQNSNAISGKLISAVWDPWANLDEHLADLKTTDIYTLRRITPIDRGLAWGDL